MSESRELIFGEGIQEQAEAMEEEMLEDTASPDTPGEEKEKQPEGKPRTVVVPDVQDMDYYVRRHYRSYILAQLNEMLVTGELSELLDTVVVSQQIDRDSCLLTGMTYWRVDRTDFLADIDLQVSLKIEQGHTDTEQTFHGQS